MLRDTLMTYGTFRARSKRGAWPEVACGRLAGGDTVSGRASRARKWIRPHLRSIDVFDETITVQPFSGARDVDPASAGTCPAMAEAGAFPLKGDSRWRIETEKRHIAG
ncbi:MAG: hypothetical protein ACRD2A_22220 [Vicinamibacterales bacterium]